MNTYIVMTVLSAYWMQDTTLEMALKRFKKETGLCVESARLVEHGTFDEWASVLPQRLVAL